VVLSTADGTDVAKLARDTLIPAEGVEGRLRRARALLRLEGFLLLAP
jgi:hypothetical protein